MTLSAFITGLYLFADQRPLQSNTNEINLKIIKIDDWDLMRSLLNIGRCQSVRRTAGDALISHFCLSFCQNSKTNEGARSPHAVRCAAHHRRR